jgi:hypothetical protein
VVVWFGSSVIPFLLSPVQVVSLSQFSCVSPGELTDARGSGKGWARSQIIRPPESVVDHKSFNTLWCQHREELPWEANIDTVDKGVVSRIFPLPPSWAVYLLSTIFLRYLPPCLFIYLSVFYTFGMYKIVHCTVYKQNKKAEQQWTCFYIAGLCNEKFMFFIIWFRPVYFDGQSFTAFLNM